MDYSTPGFPVHYQLPELAQTHVHLVSGDIQPSHPLLSFLFFNINLFILFIYLFKLEANYFTIL